MILYQTYLITKENVTLYSIYDVNDELDKHLTFHNGYVSCKRGKLGNELI